MSYRVNKGQCKTCIFGPLTPLTPSRFQELRIAWEGKGIVQQCHNSTRHGGDVACRGHYEATKRGDILSPVDELGERIFPHFSHTERYEMLERMGLIVFVEVEE